MWCKQQQQLTQRQRVVMFAIISALAVTFCVGLGYTLGAYITDHNGTHSDSEPSGGGGSSSSSGDVVLSVAPTTSRPTTHAPSATPTSAPSSAPSSPPPSPPPSAAPLPGNATNGAASASAPTTSAFIDTVTPWGFGACVVVFVAMCTFGAWWHRRQRARGEDCWPRSKKMFEYAHVIQPPPRPYVDVQPVAAAAGGAASTIVVNAAAEQAQVNRVRARVCPPPPAPTPIVPIKTPRRLALDAEDEIDMADMPKISAIHYNLPPGERLQDLDDADDDDKHDNSTAAAVQPRFGDVAAAVRDADEDEDETSML